MCEAQSQGMWHRWSLKHQQHKVGDRAGEVRGKKRQGQESVESTSEYHCTKDGRIAVRVCVEIDGTGDEYLQAQEELNNQILKKGK